jgi:hypothetical protein
MQDSYTLIFNRNGTVSLSGIGQPKATLHHATNDIVVLKVPGHKYWVGIGMDWGYAPVEFQVYQLTGGSKVPDLEDEETFSIPFANHVRAVRVVQFDAKKGGK